MSTNPFDQASRYLVKLDPLGILRWLLAKLAATLTFRGWLDTRTIPIPGHPERTCDTVACLIDTATPEELWAVPVEFQAGPDEEMFGRVLEYLGRVWRELRPGGLGSRRYSVAALVVNLTGRGNTSRDLRLGRTGVRTCLQVGERNLAKESAAATLRAIAAGQVPRCVLALIPLMRGGAKPSIIAPWKRLAEAEPDSKLRSDYAALALVFAELARCQVVWKEALRGWNMQQSQQVLEWQTEALKQGKAESVLRVLRKRLKTPVPAEVAAFVHDAPDAATLDKWIDVAVEVSSLDEFRRRIKFRAK